MRRFLLEERVNVVNQPAVGAAYPFSSRGLQDRVLAGKSGAISDVSMNWSKFSFSLSLNASWPLFKFLDELRVLVQRDRTVHDRLLGLPLSFRFLGVVERRPFLQGLCCILQVHIGLPALQEFDLL